VILALPVATSKDQKAKLHTCSQCGAERALDQRYCISCGARLGSLPAAIRGQLGRVVSGATAASAAVVDSAKPEKYDGWPFKRSEFMPSPRTAAAAVLVMLGLGVALGSVTQQVAQSAGFSTILLESPPPAEEEAPEVASVEPEVEETTEPAPAVTPSAVPSEVPPPLVEEPLPSEPLPEVPVEEEVPTGMPEIKHVFVIMLREGGYEETFGEASQSKFLSEELPAQGELLSNYYAVTKGQLANQIALLSGQGPTPETQANCPNYGDVVPGTESAEGQVEGNGCVYPATTKTLPGQLAEAKLKWKAYVDVEGINPFLYFHSIIDGLEAAEANAGLPQLATDLKLKAEKFPTLAYISPSPVSVPEEFLKTVVPEIKESLAYKDGGMLVITSAQAPQEGEHADESGCCINPVFPNLPPPASEVPPTGPVRETGGGGRVGLLLLSPYVEPGTTSETYFNHFSLLDTIEELLGLERIGYGADPAITGFDESIFNAGS
jgi:hypothetical protein